MDTDRAARDLDIDIRSLRYFVAVAEELSFTKAAERLFVAQQAISRDIRQLEERLGTRLFERTSRRVVLTLAGERLLVRARELITLHDGIVGDLGPDARPIVIDLMSAGRRTGARILEAARRAQPGREFRGWYGDSVGAALKRLQVGEIDIVLGRGDWRGQPAARWLGRSLVRWEPLAVMLPASHPLAALDEVPVPALAGVEIDVNPGSPEALEWIDIAEQFLVLAGARPTPPHLSAIGPENQADHLVRQGLPILTGLDHAEVPGGVIRPLVDPVPLYPWSILWRTAADGPGIAAVRDAAEVLAARLRWRERPARSWLPEPEASRAER